LLYGADLNRISALFIGKYLEQTSMGSGGNIARGFDGCIGGAAGQQAQQPQTLFGGSANGAPFHDSERIFSHSSATYRKASSLPLIDLYYFMMMIMMMIILILVFAND
jgi:hypothetical protein